jgi:hypothetical protein
VEQFVSQYWDTNNSTWINSQRGNYIYSPSTPSSIEKQHEISISAFPNPAINSIQFGLKESTNARVYNSQGMLVSSHLLDNFNNKIDVSRLANGIYSVIFDNKGNIAVSKFAKTN